jgi:deazaflavin-dependent oxidoreductase (nitroreductase family)
MNPLKKIFTRFNAFLVRGTGGRLGTKLGTQSVLLLQTMGRKTGKPRTTPVSYYRDGENYLVVASNWGADTQAAWYYNLVSQPQATIQIKDKVISVTARVATDEERPRLWKLVTSQNSQFLDYEKSTKRQIPVVILTPN